MLSNQDITRYGRQLILDQFGKDGQLKLKSKSVLIVGCGGLGCPCALYLAGAGLGKIGLLDDDNVELSNLHRQTLHTEDRVGQSKAHSALKTLQQLNSSIEYEAIDSKLVRENAIEIIKRFDIIVDATDNAITRYLVNDACVLAKKPLVSGAALRFDGQLTTYNYGNDCPCYRCLFPTPASPATVTNCGDGGVLGTIPGIIGSLQSLEVIKIALGLKPSYCGKLLLFDGLQGTFNVVEIQKKKKDCQVCGINPSIGPDLIDYQSFVGVEPCTLKILNEDERVSCKEYKEKILDQKVDHLLIDVRPSIQAGIVKLDHAINVPLKEIENEQGVEKIEKLIDEAKPSINKVFIMCRRGNASQKAVRKLKQSLKHREDLIIKDLIGGITAWSEQDQFVPVY